MILTVEALNQLENKYTPNGLGVEILTTSTITYNKINTAIANNLLPVFDSGIDDDDGIRFYILTELYIENGKYIAGFDGPRFNADTASEIMAYVTGR